jgi:hypothetical protein
MADRVSRRVDRIVGRESPGWLGTRWNRRNNAQESLTEIVGGQSLAYGWKQRLRGNSILAWVELPTVGRRRGASWAEENTTGGRRPDSFRL